jgi:Na+:H+ antiporter, NhaA family
VPDDPTPPRRRRLLGRPERRDLAFVTTALRTETVGGGILLVAAAVAIAWVNSPLSSSYRALAEWVPVDVADVPVGPLSFAVDLDLGTWAADGLLAIFFFVVGLELKRELIAGSLRRPAQAAMPIAAAVGGMIVPAGFYVAVLVLARDTDDLVGWAVPVATDIAFALAVLAVLGTHLPGSLRVFLLTLAVVDDLLAITIIAVFYTSDLQAEYLVLSLIPVAVLGLLVRSRVTSGLVLVPLAVVAWFLVHESGVHATVAGVLIGFVIPVLPPDRPGRCLASRFEHVWRPVSAGLAVPVFAFFGAGVDLRDGGLAAVVAEPAAAAVIVGLVVGKPLGVMGASYLVARFTRASLDPDLAWRDLWGLSFLTGIGFTVSLLVTELAFTGRPETLEHVRAGVIGGSLLAAVLAAVVLVTRNRHYRRLAVEEAAEEPGPDGAHTAGGVPERP